MKSSDFLTGLVTFFNDFIGAVVPGFILIAGLDLVDIFSVKIIVFLSSVMPEFYWVLLLCIAYAAGHGLLGVHRLLQPIIGAFFIGIYSLTLHGKWDTKAFEKKITDGDTYKKFVSKVNSQDDQYKTDISNLRFGDTRSFAMSISSEASELARRFMFISLFCYGVAMAVALIAVSWVCSLQDILNWNNIFPITLAVLIFFVFYVRALEFEFRSQNVPFPVALAKLSRALNKNVSKD